MFAKEVAAREHRRMMDHLLGEPYTRIKLCLPNGEVKPGLEAVFTDGELVVVKGSTFRVAYMNKESVTLEPVSLVVERGTEE